MESEFSGFVLDPAKCSQLSLEEKRELVHEIAQWSTNAPEILRSWSRRELLEIICAEMGKERKYTGLTKFKMIEHLLNLVSEKYGYVNTDNELASTKRQKKRDHPLQFTYLPAYVPLMDSGEGQPNIQLCQNLACGATLAAQDAFCKRCSCCICYRYDDNKDPSLWLTCASDPPTQEAACGMSCHLKCALKHERAGIKRNGCYAKLDGSFRCVCCGKISSLMGSWRKQLLVAKDTRRVNVMCHRISLSHEMLKGTERYKEQQRIVDFAVKKLRKEVGPLDRVPSKMGRGIVNRLPCGDEIQKLCASAVESIDSMIVGMSLNRTDATCPLSCGIRFEEASPVSVVVVLEYDAKLLERFLGCKLWHRRSTAVDYPDKPNYIVLRPEKRFLISDLDPSTEYFFKVSVFSSTRELGVWEANFVTCAPSGCSSIIALDEECTREQSLMFQANSQRDSTNSSDNKLRCEDNHSKLRLLEEISKNDGCNPPPPMLEAVPIVGSMLAPLKSCKSNGTQDIPDSVDKKQQAESNYEYCVRVIRWLEREGHMEKDFRVKFLTWFSLRSTMKERRVVSAFVDTLIDDPPSLSAQLVDTFTDVICNEPKPAPQTGFCTRLWH